MKEFLITLQITNVIEAPDIQSALRLAGKLASDYELETSAISVEELEDQPE